MCGHHKLFISLSNIAAWAPHAEQDGKLIVKKQLFLNFLLVEMESLYFTLKK